MIASGAMKKIPDISIVVSNWNSYDIIEEALFGKRKRTKKNNLKLPVRTPIMCAGCPYLGIFHTLKKLGLFVAGDIGCYTLAALSPYNAIDSTLCMGAGICQAFGMEKVLKEEERKKLVVGYPGPQAAAPSWGRLEDGAVIGQRGRHERTLQRDRDSRQES